MLRKLMKEKGYTQQKLEAETEIAQSIISKICNGKHIPTLEQAFLLRDKVGIPVEYWDKSQLKKTDENEVLDDKAPV